jgi:hypothetical protein
MKKILHYWKRRDLLPNSLCFNGVNETCRQISSLSNNNAIMVALPSVEGRISSAWESCSLVKRSKIFEGSQRMNRSSPGLCKLLNTM